MPLVRLENFQQFSAINLLSDPGAIGGPKIIPNCAQISLVWTLPDTKLAHQVFTGRYPGTFNGTQAQANSIMTAFSSGGAWSTLAAFFSTDTFLSAVTIRDLNTANQPLIQSNVASAAGTSASPALPNETAVNVTLRTALAGRANRGRSYVPGWATNALGAGNVVAAAAVTALNAWAQTWPNALAAGSYTLVIGQPARAAYTGSSGTQHPARAAGSVQVTSLVVRDNHWDSQRRRGLK